MKRSLNDSVSTKKSSNFSLENFRVLQNSLNKKIIIPIIIIVIIIGIFAYATTKMNKTNSSIDKKVLLQTTKGDIIIQLYSDMPITAGNFEKLVSEGFYDGLIFHRVIDGFMIQGGDPQGSGMGGPGYSIKDEFTHAGGNKNNKYTISMANSGPNSGGSQFFINLVDNNFLDPKHPAFGIVIEGKEVVNAIGKVETNPNDKPLETVKILKAKII